MATNLSGLSLRDLEYVTAVARCLHFGRAAEVCGVSQPALSAQIRKLENYLGFALFERMPRGTRLTAEGEEFAWRAAALVTAARDLLSLSRGADTMAGSFRLGAIPTIGPYLLPHAISPIRESLPGLRLLFTEARTAELMRMLHEGELDAVLACTPPSDASLESHPLFTEPLLLMHSAGMTPHWPPPAGEMLMLDDGHCLRDQVLEACGVASTQSERHAPGLELLHHMVAAGEGISLVPALAAARLGEAGGLVHYSRPGRANITRDVMLLSRRSHPRRALIAELASVFQSLDLPPLTPTERGTAWAGPAAVATTAATGRVTRPRASDRLRILDTPHPRL